MDAKFLCKQIAHLSGVPVRLYEGDRLTFFYSIPSLPIDPFEASRAEVFKIQKHIGYYVTASGVYYGVVRFGASRIVMGPTSQIPLSDQVLHDIAFQIGVKRRRCPTSS